MGKALDDPKHPFVAVLGGAKVSDTYGTCNAYAALRAAALAY